MDVPHLYSPVSSMLVDGLSLSGLFNIKLLFARVALLNITYSKTANFAQKYRVQYRNGHNQICFLYSGKSLITK